MTNQIIKKDKKREWIEFLADECYDLKKYKEGKYDLKMWKFIDQAITQAVEEALVDLLTDEPENGDWRHLIMQHLDKLNK